jgi:predicted ATPase/GAF domain-containing protein/anti-anti-sigma regulatory factor/tRNA A-37 threonylcarbamoyl transferase component Bud32
MIDLPEYTLTETAYEGSETVLYRGRRDAHRAPVAVKVTRNEYPTARELGRLRREFGILEHIGHLPGVVRPIALSKCGRGLALVMEDLGACSLNDLLKAQRLDVATALKIAVSLSDTLSQIHRLNVIHKDIKPHNIMIDEATGAPRLVDFGIAARLSQETQGATSPAALEGTLPYMSPEQTGRMNRAVDLRADLYSLGATLFEMLTGAVPFPATDPTEIIHCHIARTPTPPHERSTEIPRVLSDMVMKLLGKTPEERYQSARGLKVDLEECLRQWEAQGRIAPFPLGQHDMPDELRVPQKLYGREQEVLALLLAFERAQKGAAEIVLVAGYSGVGKSALVNEIHKPIARQGGYFIRGKFDPIRRDVPLAPVVHAFRELLRQILAESPSALEAWKGRLLSALGANGRLLLDLLPELSLILGPQPELAVLGPTEAKNRFDLLVKRFLRVFTAKEHPLCIFLDDLQWADPASLQLLHLVLSDPDSKHLLVIGAYRDNEVDAAHPLRSALSELRRAGVAITELSLMPLSPTTVTELIAETLRAPPPEVAPLAALVFDKTHGNPFFLGQLLGALYEERLLRLDASSGAFVWDIAGIRGTVVTDNIVDLMVGKLKRLAPVAQRVLSLAACVGHEFDLSALATIDERAPAEVAADLWEALREGLVVPLDGEYRFLDASAGDVPAAAAAAFQITYRFLHDRVREAAYSLIADARKAEVHLSIGRLLWAQGGEAPRDEDLLEIVRHLNLGSSGITDEGERIRLATLNLQAGRKAKAATAYQAAAGYFSAGVALLGDEGWERAYGVCFALHAEGAECAYMSGALERAEALFDALLPRAESTLERARIHNLRMVLYTTLGKFADAVKAGYEGLALFGVTLPGTSEQQQAAFGAGLAEVAENLGDRRIEDLINAVAMDDPALRAVAQLLCDLNMPIYFMDPALFGASVLKQVNISLKHGHSDVSAYSYMTYGFMLAVMLGKPVEGHAFGRLALALNEKLPNAALTCKLSLSFASYLYLSQPVGNAIAHFRKARATALEVGDIVTLAAGWYAVFPVMLGAGCQLSDLREEIGTGLAVTQRTRDVTAIGVVTVLQQVVANLQGQTLDRSTLSGVGFDEAAFRAKLDDREHGAILFYYYMFKLQLLYLHGSIADAVAAAAEAEPRSVSVLGMYYTTQLPFYAGLALAALPAAETPDKARLRGEAIARHRDRLAGLAAACPENFQHQLLLIEAEQARLAGEYDGAIERYDQAIVLAKKNEFPHIEALANELCARLYLHIGKPKLARPYMSDALQGYRHWGATAKADDLAKDHAALLPELAAAERSARSRSASSTTSGTTLLQGMTITNLREAALVLRATQAIASELMLPKVIESLSKIVLENAGAQRGALLLQRDGRLFVEATFGVDPQAIEVGPSAALETRDDLSQSAALFVARTRQPLVLDDAAADERFAVDPHVAAGGARSILCLPLSYQGRLSGLLYLEHRDATSVFNEARVELLELLASQATIAIENALLVADVRAANDEVKRVNQGLAAEVRGRTVELQRANRDLGAANQRLQLELSQREQAELERAALQEQMLEAQRARLSELSTPLIPITDRIVVMPIIGTVDAERAAQVLEAALNGAQRHRARVVILDITGMKHIDADVVSTLLRTASALRLLGAQTVLTGIRADVAQTMVTLGVNLEVIVTKGTLQSGIAYALQRSGESGQIEVKRATRG